MNITTFIGIDVSKGWLDLAVDSNSKTKLIEFRIDNTKAALKKLKGNLQRRKIRLGAKTLVCFEHTGIYSTLLIKYLVTQKCPICVEVALRIKRSMGIQRGKSDQIDARRIVEYARRNFDRLLIWERPRKAILLIKDMLTLRERLLSAKNRFLVPLNEQKHFYSKTSSIYTAFKKGSS